MGHSLQRVALRSFSSSPPPVAVSAGIDLRVNPVLRIVRRQSVTICVRSEVGTVRMAAMWRFLRFPIRP